MATDAQMASSSHKVLDPKGEQTKNYVDRLTPKLAAELRRKLAENRKRQEK